MTGWNLPPGCSVRDLPGYEDPPCAVCSLHIEDCVCPECHSCQEIGRPECYTFHKNHNGHGMKLTKEQHIARQKAWIAQIEDDLGNEKFILEMMEHDPSFNFDDFTTPEE